MNTFDKHLARAAYRSDCKDRARKKRAADRHLTREQRRRQTWRIMSLLAAGCMVLLIVLALVAALTVEASADTENLAETVTEADSGQAATILEEPQEDYENEKIETALLSQATRLDNVTVTHYDVCLECCGKTDGITASGVRATPGVTVAVDPDVIPLGADVLVDYGDGEIHYYRADDVGGSVNGNHIDLCVESHEKANMLGVKTATVYWVILN